MEKLEKLDNKSTKKEKTNDKIRKKVNTKKEKKITKEK